MSVVTLYWHWPNCSRLKKFCMFRHKAAFQRLTAAIDGCVPNSTDEVTYPSKIPAFSRRITPVRHMQRQEIFGKLISIIPIMASSSARVLGNHPNSHLNTTVSMFFYLHRMQKMSNDTNKLRAPKLWTLYWGEYVPARVVLNSKRSSFLSVPLQTAHFRWIQATLRRNFSAMASIFKKSANNSCSIRHIWYIGTSAINEAIANRQSIDYSPYYLLKIWGCHFEKKFSILRANRHRLVNLESQTAIENWQKSSRNRRLRIQKLPTIWPTFKHTH